MKSAIRPVVERLECRRLLSLVPVGAQPTGPLTGKIVYTSGGHGWDWSDTLNRWATDRGDNNELVEDFGNQDQLSFYADYLFRAGATVVPMRPIGHQTSEVVLDNDSAGVTFSGTWSNSSSTRFYDEDYGATTDAIPYRFAATALTETATATYTPNIPAAGFYPVYTWVLRGTDRTSQLYEVNHTGGQTQVRIEHSMVGSGWVYLGTYYFNAGSSVSQGSVQISNQASVTGKVTIADTIRFGNGMGDVPDGPSGIGTGSISGYPREDENALHWLWRAAGQGITPSSIIGTGNVSAPSLMAEYMNADTNPFGTSVYIGFHSNAGGGRGARGLIDADASDQTPHQGDLALYLGRQINQDMQALNGSFEYNWYTGSTHTFSGQFGELDGGASAEMDMTIIEVAFHDSVEDAAIMRDPKGRDQLARSTYEGTLEYFDNWGGLATPVTVASTPINVRAASNSSGAVTLNWTAGPTGVLGAAATGYRVYASLDGYGFDGGRAVAGVGTNVLTITGFDPATPIYFKIVSTNAGGESAASEVVAVLPAGGNKRVLVVNGYDRFDRNNNVRYGYAYAGDGLVDRVWTRQNNSFDYVTQVMKAIQTSKPGLRVNSTSNEAVILGNVNLSDYHTVIWISGEESTANDTFDATEQTKVESFIAGGGNLFVTGAELGWDLDQQNNGRTFYETTLKGNYVSDDAGTYNVSGNAGSIFAGLSFAFDNGTLFYNSDYPDVIAPQAGATANLSYVGGTAGTAGIQVAGTGGRGDVVMFAFPFETITTAGNRASVMGAVLTFFGTDVSATPGTPDLLASSDSGNPPYDSDNRTNRNNSSGGTTLQFSVPNTVPGATVTIYSGATPIGSQVATTSTTIVTTNGVNVLSGTNTITARQTEAGLTQSASSSGLSVVIDTTAPTASLGGALPTAGASNWSFTVTYNDAGGIDTTTFGSGDVTVTGPGGYNAVASLVSSAGNVATYSVPAPGGRWNLADNGAYTVSQNANEVSDVAANFRPAGTIGNANVNIPFAYLVGSILHVDFDGSLTPVTLSTQTGNYAVTQNGSTLTFPGVTDVSIHTTANDDDVVFDDAPAATITYVGGNGLETLTVASGTYQADRPLGFVSPNLEISVDAGAAINLEVEQRVKSLSVAGNATLEPGAEIVLIVQSLAVTGQLDLTDNDLVINYSSISPVGTWNGSVYDGVTGLIASGRNGGGWDGNGIVSSLADPGGFTTLGVAEATEVLGIGASDTALFGNETVDGTSVLVKYTYGGDANLSGNVDIDDYGQIDFNASIGGVLTGWYNGDFDFSGSQDIDDYGIIDFVINIQGPPL